MTDHLADALNTIKTHEYAGQMKCRIRANKITSQVLKLLKDHKYLKDYAEITEKSTRYYDVELDGRINDCGVIKPRFPVKRHDWAKKEQRFIPGVGVGLLIVTTSQGIMTNVEAEDKKIGGRLVAYVY